MLDRDATDLSARLASGDLTAEALMQATLERIAAINPRLNAIVSLRPAETLLDEARAADRSPRRGWLHGIPVAVKDLVATAGIRSTLGSPLFADHVPVADDGLARRLRAAGAILIGKTNVPEFGLGSHSTNPVFGVTRNPYDPTRTAGGSSGGAGAALAARMLCIADGSDMMGSLRNPAGWNNVWSLRPSWGVVPGDPVGDTYLHQLSTNGPMGRSPADVAALLHTLAAPEPRRPFGRTLCDAAPAGPLRLGWLADWGGAWPVQPGVLPTCEAALATFAGLGHSVAPLAAPFSAPALWDSWTTLRSFAVAARARVHYDDPAQRALLKPAMIWEIERGLALTAMQIHAASEIRSRWFACAADLFDRFDVLVLPTAQIWPFPAEWDWPHDIAGHPMDTYHRWMEVVIPAGLIGLPVLTAPAGFGALGLPMGLQLIGRPGADADLLALGAAYHAETLWPQRHPPAL